MTINRCELIEGAWDDRPAVWRRLLPAAQSDDAKLLGAVNLHALQLLTGELLADAERRGGPFAVPRFSAQRSAPQDQPLWDFVKRPSSAMLTTDLENSPLQN